ncbi:MAG: hypothetical protein ACLP8S_18860 [Solirubrobacteraceae bacterium]
MREAADMLDALAWAMRRGGGERLAIERARPDGVPPALAKRLDPHPWQSPPLEPGWAARDSFRPKCWPGAGHDLGIGR